MGLKSIVFFSRRHNSKVLENVSHSLTRGTRGRIRLGNLPTLRVRRHAIRELLGLVGKYQNLYGT